MKIECPICSSSIEVTEAHIGQKGRCTNCATKFIIPAQPGPASEILERGTVPAAAPAKTLVTPAKQAPRTAATAGNKPAVKVLTSAGSAPRTLPVRQRPKKGGAAAFWITIAAVGVVLVFAYPKIAGSRNRGDDDGSVAKKEQDESAQKAPTPPPPVVTPPPVEPEPEDEDTITFNPPAPADPDAPADTATVPELDPEKKARALAFIKSDQPNKRKGAYTAFRKLGDPYKDTYAEVLQQAREHHLKQLGDKAFDLSVGENSMTSFEGVYDEWKAAADAARAMVQTHWKSTAPTEYKAKWAEMDEKFAAAENLYGRLAGAAKNAGGQEVAALQKDADVLAEIGAEIAWCTGGAAPPVPKLGDLITEAGGADGFVKVMNVVAEAVKMATDHTETADYNRKTNWTTSNYKSFAKLLNSRRAALGLGALRLDEKLSEACEAHSGDMLFQNYFSHTGQDGSTFGARARAAGFTGAASGECIFMGSPAVEAAHKAWWYSDGHRKIMYADGPNTLGIGQASSHWTLNTGKK